MKKTVLIAAGVAAVLALGGGGVYAAGQVARSSAISEETALHFACVDAGVSPESAEAPRIGFDYEKGRFVYEVDFTADGVRYEYTVDAASGSVLEKESERLPDHERGGEETGAAESIGAERAAEIALENAGVAADGAEELKTTPDKKDGRSVWKVEFRAGTREYEYVIDAATGGVLEASYEEDRYAVYPGEGGEPVIIEVHPAEPEQSGGNGRAKLLTDPESPGGTEDGPGTMHADAPPAVSVPQTDAPSAPAAPAGKPEQSAGTITVSEAKDAALGRAGVSAEDAVFSKAKLEREDGRLVYDVEFYVPGAWEYECEIDAVTGAVMEYEVEPWDD